MKPTFTNTAQKTAFKALQHVASLRAQLTDRATSLAGFWKLRARHSIVRAQLSDAEQQAADALGAMDSASRSWVEKLAARTPTQAAEVKPRPAAKRTPTQPANKREKKHGIK